MFARGGRKSLRIVAGPRPRLIMRLAVGWGLLFALPMLIPVVLAQPQALQFTDVSGDVARDGQPYSGTGSSSNDVIRAAVRENGANLEFELELLSLSELSALARDLEFHAQYALNFKASSDHEGYSMRALFGGLKYTGNPLGAWRFQIHDRDADEWSDATGSQDGDVLKWTMLKEDLSLGQGSNLTHWSVSAWNSYGDGVQSNDGAETPLVYVIGTGPVDPTAIEIPGAGFAFADPEGDVASGGNNYSGPGAETTDVVSVLLAESGADLFFLLELADLDGLDNEVNKRGFSAQYAVSFRTRPDHEGYSMRAMFGGEEYTGNAEGAWRFQIHNKQTDEWPEVSGSADESKLRWSVPRSALSVQEGDKLSDWSVQTWNSYTYRDQYGDWANTEQSYKVGEKKSTKDEDVTPVALPGAGFALGVTALTISLGGGAWWLRRYEPATRWSWRSLAAIGAFSRFSRDQLLNHQTRDHILESVRVSPGCPARDVRQGLEIPKTTFWYHVHRLEREGLLRAELTAGLVRLWEGPKPAPAGSKSINVLAVDVLRAVGENPGGTASDYARRLDKPPRTVRHQLSQLAREGSLYGKRVNAREIRWTASPTATVGTS